MFHKICLTIASILVVLTHLSLYFIDFGLGILVSAVSLIYLAMMLNNK